MIKEFIIYHNISLVWFLQIYTQHFTIDSFFLLLPTSLLLSLYQVEYYKLKNKRFFLVLKCGGYSGVTLSIWSERGFNFQTISFRRLDYTLLLIYCFNFQAKTMNLSVHFFIYFVTLFFFFFLVFLRDLPKVWIRLSQKQTVLVLVTPTHKCGCKRVLIEFWVNDLL